MDEDATLEVELFADDPDDLWGILAGLDEVDEPGETERTLEAFEETAD